MSDETAFYWRNPKAYMEATRELSLIQHGAYDRLLSLYFGDGKAKALPADREQLYRLAGAVTEAEQLAVDFVLHRFWEVTGAGFVHKLDGIVARAEEG